jgi:three-Cys-motif partner protein
MSSTKDTLWDAKPHTIAKIKILEEYLFPYFQIIGRTYSNSILYVDGFAGPGRYKNHPDGSPIASLRAATKAVAAAAGEFKAKSIIAVFVEIDNSRCELLAKAVEPFRKNAKLEIVVYEDDFATAIQELKKQRPAALRQEFAFYFIDPFGPTPVPFSLVKELLANPKAEVFLNLDADGINRIFCAGDYAKAKPNLDSIFGDDLDWPKEFSSARTNQDRGRRSLKIYIENLKKIGVEYRFSFEMRNKSDQLDYFLLFATHHPLGLVKMKEAMKRIAGNNSYQFSDGRIGNLSLFEVDDEARFGDRMHKDFESKKATYPQLNDYALNETPFLNPKKMLARLEGEDKIITEARKNVTRRKGSFPEDKIESITFKPYGTNLFD